MSRTMPQIIMLNHGMWWNHERAGLNDSPEDAEKNKVETEAAMFNGKKIADLSMTEMMAYYGKPEAAVIEG